MGQHQEPGHRFECYSWYSYILSEMRIIKFQVATNAVGPKGLVVACDLLPLEPVHGALVLAPRDFTLKETQEEIR